MTALTIPRRDTRTYVRDGQERYTDTGREVFEQHPSHIVLWIVDDPQAWARAIEADGDAEPDRWSRSRRYIGEQRKLERYASATRVRSEGRRRSWHGYAYSAAVAQAAINELYRSHPNPGVRYEVAEVTDVRHCTTCRQPQLFADEQWRHNAGGYPEECALPEPEEEEPHQAGEFEVSTGTGSVVCGWCDRAEHWAHAVLGYSRLTGNHLLGVHRLTNTLVVLFEATTLSGQVTYLPHHCPNIPEDQHGRYAPDSVLARPQQVDAPLAVGRG